MIQDIENWRRWEAAGPDAEPANIERNLGWFDAMIEPARALGVWPPAEPLEVLEGETALDRAAASVPPCPLERRLSVRFGAEASQG